MLLRKRGRQIKGGIDSKLDNYNNLVGTLNHEKYHYEAGDPNKVKYTFTDHISVYEKQIADKAFSKTDNEFKTNVAIGYAGYLLGALKKEEITEQQFVDKVNAANNIFKKSGISISVSFSSADLPAVSVNGRNNKGNATQSNELLKPKKEAY